MSDSILVIGGGVAGIQASLDLADRGLHVYLVEREPSIGGHMAQLDKTFPTNDCSICILAPKMIECFNHQNITVLTYSEVKEVKGSAGDFKVKVLKKARYVDENKCTGCGKCSNVCPIKVPNQFDMNLGIRKAIYLPFLQAVPRVMTIDTERCLYFQKGVCKVCEKKACERGAIDFEQKEKEIDLDVGAIIVATGFGLYDPSEFTEYGYGQYKNVLTAMEFERLICASGPTGGRLEVAPDKRHPKKIAFIQCVGSRDINRGRRYCSTVCCMNAIKQAILSKEHYSDVECYVLYAELRAFGKYFQEYVTRAKEQYGVRCIRSKPGEITEDPKTLKLAVWYDDTVERKLKKMEVDLVVLATALTPARGTKELVDILGIKTDENGFFETVDALGSPTETNVDGIYVCGCSESLKDIPEVVMQASGAAAKASEVIALMRGSK